MSELKDILLGRLEKKGVEPGLIPNYIRIVTQVLLDMKDANLEDINKRLLFLGLNDIELDEQTFQLLIANLESDDFSIHPKERDLFRGNTLDSGRIPEMDP